MAHEKEELLNDRVFFYFDQICQIPHPSGGEKAISDYVLSWARGLGLSAEQDEVNNVLIRKPASPGYEKAPVTMLQAHLDMVCEKVPGSPHDFLKDPIAWVIDGEMLSTGGQTTLGADDGVGMALAMAILEDPTLCHPELEALFTVNEEDDFTGASRFDGDRMRADYVINLDNANEDEILCGSCGGMEVDFHMPVAPEQAPAPWQAYRLQIGGLRGGHSGEDIHRGYGSANMLLARALLEAEAVGPFLIADIQGGSFRLAIPRDAAARICMDPRNAESLRARLGRLLADARAELACSGGNVHITLEPAGSAGCGVQPGRVLSAMMLVPDGIFQMNEALTGVVNTSDNLGEVYLDEKELHMVLEIRSERNSLRTYLFERMERLAGLLGARCTCCNPYPSWEFRPESALRTLAARLHREQFGEEPTILTLHGGLEVGYLFEKRPSIDAIAVGPDCWDYHSPTERLSIPSTKRMYRYLCALLQAIHETQG